MKIKTEEEVNHLRKMYPIGTSVMCIHMEDPYSPVPKGTKGTIEYVDDIGQIHCKWGNGSSLALNTDVDTFKIIE